ncbi:MAG: OsmC family protein [Armatimonadetes bacterium]|nr:OsmC family protein [Armatimonadota bacterium]MBS1710280.1 OsmC family protein [Armatimonadota bacterium]MBX3109083.1 OsmC family protein [Fimbriimonadaceae bacterium]
MAKMHEYPVTVRWQGGRGGSGQASGDRSGTASPLATPPEFGGSGNGTNPEELLAKAVAGCYSITFGIIAETRRIPLVGVETHATGVVEENGPQFTYQSITIRPTITLSADATDEQVALAEQMSHKADLYCIITNAIRDKVSISVEPTIIRG